MHQIDFGFWIADFGFNIFPNLKSKIQNSNLGRSSMDLERFTTNEQVKGSSPFVPSNFIFFRSRPAEGRLILNQETEVRILSPKPFFLIRAFRRRLYGLALGASVREFESRRPYQFLFFSLKPT
jgi:hypothetical protein